MPDVDSSAEDAQPDPPPARAARRTWPRRAIDFSQDARHLQIAVLSALLLYGAVALDFEVDPRVAALVIIAALATQLGFSRLGGQRFDVRSPLISALSLCLLLRAADPIWLCAAAALAVASKFVIRRADKHVFNPTNFAIVVLLATTDTVWVSPGQWGTTAVASAALVLAGSLVLRRAERADVTFAFLAAWAGLLVARSVWLGEPFAIPLHRVQNGALLIFAFLMLSDPRTTPDSRAGRVAFAVLVASIGAGLRFGLYEPNALLFALALCAPCVPLLDRWLPGRRFTWRGPSHAAASRAPATPCAATPGARISHPILPIRSSP